MTNGINMEKEIFNREIKICREIKNSGNKCMWGECEKCGVIPLLYKLQYGKLLEDESEIKDIKNKIFNAEIN